MKPALRARENWCPKKEAEIFAALLVDVSAGAEIAIYSSLHSARGFEATMPSKKMQLLTTNIGVVNPTCTNHRWTRKQRKNARFLALDALVDREAASPYLSILSPLHPNLSALSVGMSSSAQRPLFIRASSAKPTPPQASKTRQNASSLLLQPNALPH